MTFYQEHEQPSSSALRRRNRRWIVGIFVVVGLMVAAAVVGALAASGSNSGKVATDAPAKPGSTKTTKKSTTSSAHGGATAANGQSGKTRGALVPGGTLPDGATLPKVVPGATVTVAPASPAVINAYIAAFRKECQSIWSHADADGLLWDPDDPSSGPHKISECYAAMDPQDESLYNDIPDAQQYAHDNVDSAVEDMTLAYHLRSTKGVVFDVP